jgi:hypothetical protein
MNADPLPEAVLVWENEGGQLRLPPPDGPRDGVGNHTDPANRNVRISETVAVPPPRLPSSSPDRRNETRTPPDVT